jgi:hypothetical protein
MDPLEKGKALFTSAVEERGTTDAFLLYYVNGALHGGNLRMNAEPTSAHEQEYCMPKLPGDPASVARIIIQEYQERQKDLPQFICDSRAALSITSPFAVDTMNSRLVEICGQPIDIYVAEYLYAQDADRIYNGIERMIGRAGTLHTMPERFLAVYFDDAFSCGWSTELVRKQEGYDCGPIMMYRQELGPIPMFEHCALEQLPIVCGMDDRLQFTKSFPYNIRGFHAVLRGEESIVDVYFAPELFKLRRRNSAP